MRAYAHSLFERLDEALDLAVPAWRVGRREDVAGADARSGPPAKPRRAVGEARCRSSPPRPGRALRACRRSPARAPRPLSCRAGRRCCFDVGEAGVVVDDAVHVDVAGAARLADLLGAITGDRSARAGQSAPALGVDVQQRPGSRPLVATVASAADAGGPPARARCGEAPCRSSSGAAQIPASRPGPRLVSREP